MLFGKLAPSPVCGLYEVCRRERRAASAGRSPCGVPAVSRGAGVWGYEHGACRTCVAGAAEEMNGRGRDARDVSARARGSHACIPEASRAAACGGFGVEQFAYGGIPWAEVKANMC
jgi:hypothetical protein